MYSRSGARAAQSRLAFAVSATRRAPKYPMPTAIRNATEGLWSTLALKAREAFLGSCADVLEASQTPCLI